MNYKYCLVKISLAPEYVGKFALLKDEMTVQENKPYILFYLFFKTFVLTPKRKL